MEILTDALHRIAYATDASAYREMPIGVAYPKTEEDIRFLMQEARKRHTHLIPRAGGTSIAGQVVGSGLVVDVSRYMNQILHVDAEKRLVRVQPGVVRDELNLALRPYGLFFSPETSTSNRCCIGGMVGNNSCGTHSLIYGSTRHHVVGLRVLLADGCAVELTNDTITPIGNGSLLLDKIVSQLKDWQNSHEIKQSLAAHFPDSDLRRRSCGYALDEALDGMEQSGIPDLCKLITGSEGTLCFVTEITLSLDLLPPAHTMVVCEMLDNLNDAWEANLIALSNQPSAVELIDGRILELAKDNISARQNMEVLHLDINHLPQAILVSEYRADNIESLSKRTDIRTYSSQVIRLFDVDVQKVWNLRKAGLGVLTSMEGDAKPIGVIEDTAVAPKYMGAYMADFQQMLAHLGLECVYYGHISTGELHLRPILNIKKEEDRRLFREVAIETAHLVKKYHGSLSGEHGDGRLRGEFIPLMYGQDIYNLFCDLKQTWDPDGIFNIGKIVHTPPMDEYMRYEVGQAYAGLPNDDESIALMQRVERCNGAGDCRKSNLIGGTMCPAFKSTGEELMTTRARANVLREKLTHDPHAILSKEVNDVLDSCLACKGCRGECPSNVDMTRLRSELLTRKYQKTGIPVHVWMVAHMAWFERIGSVVPHIYNFFATNSITESLLKKIVHFAVERHIPTLSNHSMRQLVKRMKAKPVVRKKGKVYLFADEFTSYQEAELGLHFAQLITYLGYEVEIPKHVESGRAAISKGCLPLAAKFAKRNIQLLSPYISEHTPLIGIEPSCILSFRDEYPRLVALEQREKAQKLAKACLLYDEWIMREVKEGRISSKDFSSIQADLWLHGHCHQKALVGVEKTADCLRLIPDINVRVIPSGCCGMAGSYGYEQQHYASSMAIGEMVLFPAVRKATAQTDKEVIVCAPGTSCRQQIKDGTGVEAVHPIEILYRAVKKCQKTRA